VFESTLNRQSQAAYFGPHDVPSGKPWRDAELLEIIHIACIANGKWEKCWKGPNGSALKEKAANAMFFYRIANQDTNDVHITVQLCVLAHLLAPFGCDLASSLQKQRQLAFQSYHEMPSCSTRRCTIPQAPTT
jgi:hypothetical protein